MGSEEHPAHTGPSDCFGGGEPTQEATLDLNLPQGGLQETASEEANDRACGDVFVWLPPIFRCVSNDH